MKGVNRSGFVSYFTLQLQSCVNKKKWGEKKKKIQLLSKLLVIYSPYSSLFPLKKRHNSGFNSICMQSNSYFVFDQNLTIYSWSHIDIPISLELNHIEP